MLEPVMVRSSGIMPALILINFVLGSIPIDLIWKKSQKKFTANPPKAERQTLYILKLQSKIFPPN
jgi:hypothetical protein